MIPKHKVTLRQGEVKATFKLTDNELQELEHIKVPYFHNKVYTSAMYVYADYVLTRNKRDRFHRIFCYSFGDFYFEIN